ncbi:hypothetical protein [Actinoplanes awajinensis]|uniref:Heavy metal-binding domain-containing protein n=1 Tax=Actinoplanes awajinensis subsp. mycoplanecinus TaxID=135947 RepID=A0A0X3URS0_9ACTN|nr:hypothetical protein [Actinoplanes awajinensis]KUL35268.1 hypothetical protein ADL15_14710 [Actinoplanes awajinensis subsp. mycoplanecinus]
MKTSVRLTAYAMGLIVVFGVALSAGRFLGPDEKPAAAPAHTDEHGGHQVSSAQLPAGLQITQDGYTLSPVTTRFTPGAAQTFAFRILGPDGKAVTQYSADHGTELHLIVVRRDLTGYQHLHPTRAADGTWSAAVTVRDSGQYRVFADFTPLARAEGFVLGVDVPAAGDYQPRELPAPGWQTEVDGYTVTRAGEPQAGTTSWMTVSVSKGGQPVTLEPYLGSFGHLVALRQGDLAYLHMHPQDGTVAGPDITVDAAVPGGGTYRLFLEFQHGGKVHLAEFTAVTGAGHTHN